ncbi:helix-turn-helix domain-containing protein [Oerskovia sp. NPDC060287]|uniref:helix-turn-helix domain-containing protein n=1 Tax=Oerskovia sp. NPDC060287 TaxID=3347095 RepID=UPI00365A1963
MGELTTKDVAAELRASTETVRNLIASGDLRVYRLRGERGPWRITPQVLEAYREHQARRAADPWVRTRPRRRT